MVALKPRLWEESQALDVFTLYNKISIFHPKIHPISREMILAIFFEETGCSNIRQEKDTGPAVGFGQTQIYDGDKVKFFKTLGFNSDRNDKSSSLELITPEKIKNDHNLSVKITCKYFQWLCARPEDGGQGKSALGALQAQTGESNYDLIPRWQSAENMLKTDLHRSDRRKIAIALNQAKRSGKGIPFDVYVEYWKFTVPDNEMLRNIRE